MSTTKRIALITGASSGIGAVYAHRLAHRGYDLILVARDAARLEGVAERLCAETGRAIEVVSADLSIGADIKKISNRLEAEPRITLLVNNAGIALSNSVLVSGPEQLERLIAVNITASTLLAAAAGEAFAARKAGTIVNIASVLALAPEMLDRVYSGSKAFLLNLSIDLAGRLRESGVHVQAVLPGATRTAIRDISGRDIDAILPGKVMDAGDLVDAALAGLDKGGTITIPPLADEGLWTAYTDARLALAPHVSASEVAARYQTGGAM